MSEKMPWTERREIGPCTLYLGDCLALLAAGQIPTEAAIVSDPPYGINYRTGASNPSSWGLGAEIPRRRLKGPAIIGDDAPWDPAPWLAHGMRGAASRISGAKAVSRAGSMRMALLGADAYAARLPPSGAWYCWDKSCGGGPADSFTDAEFIWMSARNARRVYRHKWKGRLRQGDSEARCHIAQKPVPLMMWMIETVRTPVGSLVCDPYMGSGTTGLACLANGRRFLGIEIDPAHYAVACTRIERAYAKQQAPTLPPSPVYP